MPTPPPPPPPRTVTETLNYLYIVIICTETSSILQYNVSTFCFLQIIEVYEYDIFVYIGHV